MIEIIYKYTINAFPFSIYLYKIPEEISSFCCFFFSICILCVKYIYTECIKGKEKTVETRQ